MKDWLTAHHRRIVPIVVPVLIVGVCYLTVIEPRARAARRAQAETIAVRARLSAIPVGVTVPRGEIASVNTAGEFEHRVPATDPVPDLLERLARVALEGSPSGSLRRLKIETADRVELAGPGAEGGPRVASTSTDQPDPRFALFATSLTYTLISVKFEATYPALGGFLWNLRNLPTAIEIRSLDVTHVAVPAEDSRFLQVELVLFAFQRGAATPS